MIVMTADTIHIPEQLRTLFMTSSSTDARPRFSPADLATRISSSTPPPTSSALPAAGANATPSTVETPTIWGGQLAVGTGGPRLVAAPPEWIVAGTPEAAVLVRLPFGQGQIYLMLDGECWANAGLDRAGNAAALYRLLRQELKPNGVLAVDQYRHGRGRVDSFTTFLLMLPGAKAFCTMFALIAATWVWSRNQRLGPAEAYHEVERRTAREYVEAVAAMNQRARAAPLAVKAVADRVRSLLHQRGATTVATDDLQLQAAHMVEQKQRPRTPRSESDLVCQLVTLRKKLYGSRQDS